MDILGALDTLGNLGQRKTARGYLDLQAIGCLLLFFLFPFSFLFCSSLVFAFAFASIFGIAFVSCFLLLFLFLILLLFVVFVTSKSICYRYLRHVGHLR